MCGSLSSLLSLHLQSLEGAETRQIWQSGLRKEKKTQPVHVVASQKEKLRNKTLIFAKMEAKDGGTSIQTHRLSSRLPSSLFALLEWKGKTSPVLKSFRKSLEADLKEALEEKVIDGSAFTDVATTISAFLKVANRLIHSKWFLQKERLCFLIMVLRNFHPPDLVAEHRWNTGLCPFPWLQPGLENSSFRFANLEDFLTLEDLCKKQREKVAGGSLILQELSPETQKWLSTLVWIKRVDSERRSYRSGTGLSASYFIYPSKGMVSCESFDERNVACAPGLHFTLVMNQAAFAEFGTHLLCVTLPHTLVINGKTISNKLMIASLPAPHERSKDHFKFRVMGVDVQCALEMPAFMNDPESANDAVTIPPWVLFGHKRSFPQKYGESQDDE